MATNDVKSGSAGGQDELVFLALGGLGEIGMNVYLYGFGPEAQRQWLMVDLGITFPAKASPASMWCCRISSSSMTTRNR